MKNLTILFVITILVSCATMLPEKRYYEKEKPRKRTSELIKQCVLELNVEGNAVKESTEACLSIYRAR